jgi:hypothetical protein
LADADADADADDDRNDADATPDTLVFRSLLIQRLPTPFSHVSRWY